MLDVGNWNEINVLTSNFIMLSEQLSFELAWYHEILLYRLAELISQYFNKIFDAFNSQGYTIFNILSLFIISYGKSETERLPFLLYHACIQPLDHWSLPIFNLMPVNQILLYIVEFVWISGNLYLYKYLQLNTKRRKGIYFSFCHLFTQ